MERPRLHGPTLLLLLLALTGVSRATDWELSLDGRLVASDAYHSFMDGGFGTVRFGSDDAGVKLGRARLAVTQPLGELFSAHLDASVFDDKDRSALGVTEAYLLFRPYPRGGYRFRVKAGGFYPPVSLENRSSGWESPYSLSYSAINSWLAVEVRTLGIEGTLDWLGTRTGHAFDLGLTAGVFGWNDRAGVMVASNGFVLTDRQTPLFGRLGQPGVAPLNGAEPFMEIDHRAGAYVGLEARYLDRAVLRVLRYDNRADPAAADAVSQVLAWQTRFTSAGLRVEGEHGWTAIVQWLGGITTIAPPSLTLNWPFQSTFGLLSKRFGRSTLSARYDRFAVQTNAPGVYGAQDGHAWTGAYIFDRDAHWRFTLECVRVTSSSANREDQGGPALATETQWQLAVRYALGSAIR
ncbi:MAG: hypothetical protein JOY74_08610 [Sinobacteraceae bacterium]|nr:hypothetical protein [Nevskiaceae bacterium]